jgi:phage head maturation protease
MDNYKCGDCGVEGVAGDVVHLPDCANTAPDFDQSELRSADAISEIRDVDTKKRKITHLISTASIDRYNDVIDVGGWNLRHFRKNPVVLKDHNYTVDNIIGKAISVEKRDGGLVATTQFVDTEVGREAMALVEAGIAKAWSVGFRGLDSHSVGEGRKAKCETCKKTYEKLLRGRDAEETWIYGRHFTRAELMEYSLVAIPANQDVVMNAVRKGYVAEENVKRWFKSADDLRTGKPNEDLLRVLADTLHELSDTNKRLVVFLNNQQAPPAKLNTDSPSDEEAAVPNAKLAEAEQERRKQHLAASLRRLAHGMKKRAENSGDN